MFPSGELDRALWHCVADEEMRAARARHRVDFGWKQAIADLRKHGVAACATIAHLLRCDRNRLNSVVGQMDRLDTKGSAEARLPSQMIKSVVKPVVFIGALVTGPHAPKHDGSVRKLGHLVGFDDNPSIRKVESDWLGAAESPSSTRFDKCGDEARGKPTVIGSKTMIDRTAILPDRIEGCLGFFKRRFTAAAGLREPADQVIQTVVRP